MASFISNLRMNNIYGNPGELGPPNLNSSINFDEVSNLLNRLRNSRNAPDAESYVARDIGGPNRLSNIAGQPVNTQPDYKFDLSGGAGEEFAKNIINPPERALPFQQLAEKRNEFGANIGLKGAQLNEKKNEFAGNLGIKQQGMDINQQKADTSQYSAETRKQLADLHNLPDSEKLRLLQEGKVDIQHIRDAAALSQIGARGTQTRETEGVRQQDRKDIQGMKGQQRLGEIAAKPSSAMNTGRDAVNKARQLKNSRPDLAPFITFDDKGQPVIDLTNSSPEQQNEIRGTIYGTKGDINLPADKKSQSSNDTIMMKHPNGTVGPVSKKDVEAALQAGYTKQDEE